MGQTEIEIFIILVGGVVLVLVAGTLLFIIQYRNRKIRYAKEKKKMEETHQIELLNSQLLSQRQTMEHIGQEIHDSVAQKLTLASIYIHRLQFEQKAVESGGGLESAGKIIDDALLELRQLSKDLTNAKLFETELGELVNDICMMVNSSGACRAVLVTHDIPPLPVHLKNGLLRVIQEFVQNSLKHAACKQIGIFISTENGKLILKLEDDGKGFETDVAVEKGIGLDNIRRRVQLMKGVFQLNSKENTGTRLELTVPV
jgi:signal transduction histidine kinase